MASSNNLAFGKRPLALSADVATEHGGGVGSRLAVQLQAVCEALMSHGTGTVDLLSLGRSRLGEDRRKPLGLVVG